MLAAVWRSLWRNQVALGNPVADPGSWHYERACNVPYPPFRLLRYSKLEDGGLKIMLFRRLAFVDTGNSLPYYLPMLWFEYVIDKPRRFMFRICPPWVTGSITAWMPLGAGAIVTMGVWRLQYDRFPSRRGARIS